MLGATYTAIYSMSGRDSVFLIARALTPSFVSITYVLALAIEFLLTYLIIITELIIGRVLAIVTSCIEMLSIAITLL